ncbi:MAG: ThuA domain-containing protein [Pyrinomonadaceae bacterium]
MKSKTRLYRFVCLLCLLAGAACAVSAQQQLRPKKLLVVTVTKGFRHASIPTAEKMLEQLGAQSKSFTVDYARSDEELAAKMTMKALAAYDGVIFASTTGDLPLPDRDGFLNWIKAGHAFIGIHAAADTFHNYAPFVEMINGEFKAHGPQIKVLTLNRDAKHPAMKDWGASREVYDEIYVYKNHDPAKVDLLMCLDKNPNEKDPQFNQAGSFPLAWSRTYGKGRVFYTALGHREDVLEADYFKTHLLGGIRWALGVK